MFYIHRANLSSKYVSEFFGLTDNVFVKKRNDRDIEVHMCRITREEKDRYLEKMENKFAVLYDYNPNDKTITPEESEEIIQEQIKYENEQFENIMGIRKTTQRYTGTIDEAVSKLNKIGKLKDKLKKIRKKPENPDSVQRRRIIDNPLSDWGDDLGDR